MTRRPTATSLSRSPPSATSQLAQEYVSSSLSSSSLTARVARRTGFLLLLVGLGRGFRARPREALLPHAWFRNMGSIAPNAKSSATTASSRLSSSRASLCSTASAGQTRLALIGSSPSVHDAATVGSVLAGGASCVRSCANSCSCIVISRSSTSSSSSSSPGGGGLGAGAGGARGE